MKEEERRLTIHYPRVPEQRIMKEQSQRMKTKEKCIKLSQKVLGK